MTELGLILGISILGLAFAGYLIKWVLARDTGTPAMREVSDAIKSGAEAFLRRQNKTIATMAAGLACLIFIDLRVRAAARILRPHRNRHRARLVDDTVVRAGRASARWPRATSACGSRFEPMFAPQRRTHARSTMRCRSRCAAVR